MKNARVATPKGKNNVFVLFFGAFWLFDFECDVSYGWKTTDVLLWENGSLSAQTARLVIRGVVDVVVVVVAQALSRPPLQLPAPLFSPLFFSSSTSLPLTYSLPSFPFWLTWRFYSTHFGLLYA